ACGGAASTSLAPLARSARSTAGIASTPCFAISSTGLLDPRPITASISPVAGIRRCGIRCCASAASGRPPAPASATSAAPAEDASPRSSRRVVLVLASVIGASSLVHRKWGHSAFPGADFRAHVSQPQKKRNVPFLGARGSRIALSGRELHEAVEELA